MAARKFYWVVWCCVAVGGYILACVLDGSCCCLRLVRFLGGCLRFALPSGFRRLRAALFGSRAIGSLLIAFAAVRLWVLASSLLLLLLMLMFVWCACARVPARACARVRVLFGLGAVGGEFARCCLGSESQRAVLHWGCAQIVGDFLWFGFVGQVIDPMSGWWDFGPGSCGRPLLRGIFGGWLWRIPLVGAIGQFFLAVACVVVSGVACGTACLGAYERALSEFRCVSYLIVAYSATVPLHDCDSGRAAGEGTDWQEQEEEKEKEDEEEDEEEAKHTHYHFDEGQVDDDEEKEGQANANDVAGADA